MNYYTLQIHFGSSIKAEVHELKDLNPGTMEEKAWISSLRAKIYTTGFNIETAPGTIQLISPFIVTKIFLIKQDGKFAID